MINMSNEMKRSRDENRLKIHVERLFNECVVFSSDSQTFHRRTREGEEKNEQKGEMLSENNMCM